MYFLDLYKKRHDKVLSEVVGMVARASGLKVPDNLVWGKAHYTGVGSFGNRIVHIQVDMRRGKWSVPGDQT